jgi:hypothetical protein
VGRVNSVFKAEADKDTVWRQHCIREWEDRRGLLCIPTPTSLGEYLSDMKIRELKRLLQLNDVPMTGFRERKEFVLALRAQYICPAKVGRNKGPIPWWLQQMTNWKASFFFMQVDCKRTKISTNELCDPRRKWVWHFEQHSNMSQYTIESKFSPDGCYTSSYRDGTNKTWQFIDGVVGGSGVHIQVGDYPSLTVNRNKDWSWGMHNSYGHFTEHYLKEEEEEDQSTGDMAT